MAKKFELLTPEEQKKILEANAKILGYWTETMKKQYREIEQKSKVK